MPKENLKVQKRCLMNGNKDQHFKVIFTDDAVEQSQNIL